MRRAGIAALLTGVGAVVGAVLAGEGGLSPLLGLVVGGLVGGLLGLRSP